MSFLTGRQSNQGAMKSQSIMVKEFGELKSFIQRNPQVLLFILILIGSRIAAASMLHIFDDAFITYRYAHNLANGFGFVYNPGEWVLGTTAPAFGLLVSVFEFLNLPTPAVVTAMNILLDIALFLLAIRLWPKSGDDDNLHRRFFILFFAILFIASPRLGRTTVGGMEMNLFVFVSLISIYFFSRPTSPKPFVAIVFAAIAYTLRLETGLLMAILCLYELFFGKAKTAIIMGFIGGGIVLSVAMTTFLVYGTWVPQSVIAKESISDFSALEVFREIYFDAPLVTAMLPVVLIGLFFSWHDSKTIQILSCWFLLYTIAYVSTGPLIFPWYGMPIYFSVIFLGAYMLAKYAMYLRLKVKHGERFIQPNPALIGIPVVTWILFYFVFGVSPVIHNVYAPLKDWCEQEAVAGSEYLAWDIGAIGYYCDGYIHDMAGLVSPHYTPYESFDLILEESAPKYIFANATAGQLASLDEVPGRYNYEPVAPFTREGVPLDEVVYPNVSWIQSYVVYELQDPR